MEEKKPVGFETSDFLLNNPLSPNDMFEIGLRLNDFGQTYPGSKNLLSFITNLVNWTP